MSGNRRRGFAAAVSSLFVPAVAALVLTAAPAHAGDLDEQLQKPQAPAPTMFGAQATELKATSAELDDKGTTDAVDLAKVWLADYHPETDRWTERNNRIKITLFGSALFFGNNMRIYNDAGVGLRVSWEVPGFIGIRLDSVLVPWSHMVVRNVGKTSTNNSNRSMQGFVDCTSLSIAIFNPELSTAPNLAMWAGFGVDLWEYHYDDFIHGANGASRRYQYVDWNLGGNLFFNLEYKISDIFHIGFEIREHIVYVPQTERGRFYKIDNLVPGIGLHTVGSPHSRDQAFAPLSAVEEFQLHVSVLF